MIDHPDWIAGGDPIQMHWLGETPEVHLSEFKWQEQARWTSPSGSIWIETGRSADRRVRAYRVVGEISGTSRSLEGEIGWCWNDGDLKNIVAPLISAEKWASEWQRYCHGKIDHLQLVNNLLGVETNESIELQGVHAKTPRYWPQAFIFLILGILVGYLGGTRIPLRKPPEPKAHQLESDQHSSESAFSPIDGRIKPGALKHPPDSSAVTPLDPLD